MRVARAVEPVAGEADPQSPPDEPVGESVLREVGEEPACDHRARAVGPCPTGVPSERGRAEQRADLDGVALGDGEGESGRDALWCGHASSIVVLVGIAVFRVAKGAYAGGGFRAVLTL